MEKEKEKRKEKMIILVGEETTPMGNASPSGHDRPPLSPGAPTYQGKKRGGEEVRKREEREREEEVPEIGTQRRC